MNYQKNAKLGKKLLILFDHDFIGGAEVNYRYILPELPKRKWKVIFLSPGEKNIRNYFEGLGIDATVLPYLKPYTNFCKNGGVSFLNISLSFMALLKNRRIVNAVIKNYHPEVIISNSMISHWLLALLGNSRVVGKKVVHLQDITDRSKAFGMYGLGLDWIASRVNKIITISDSVIYTLSERFHKKVTKLYNPVFDKMPSRKTQDNVLRVGMFARYTPWKGHKDLLKIARCCDGRNIEFVCFGNVLNEEIGYYKELSAQVATTYNISNVTLNRFISDIYVEMVKCDIILHLSKLPEPFGRILIEANACNVPVFAYKGGGVEELFRELQLAGRLFESGGWESVAQAIRVFDGADYKFPDLSELSPSAYVDRFLSVIT